MSTLHDCLLGISFYYAPGDIYLAVNHTQVVETEKLDPFTDNKTIITEYGHPAFVVVCDARQHYEADIVTFTHEEIATEGFRWIPVALALRDCSRIVALASIAWRASAERRAA